MAQSDHYVVTTRYRQTVIDAIIVKPVPDYRVFRISRVRTICIYIYIYLRTERPLTFTERPCCVIFENRRRVNAGQHGSVRRTSKTRRIFTPTVRPHNFTVDYAPPWLQTRFGRRSRTYRAK